MEDHVCLYFVLCFFCFFGVFSFLVKKKFQNATTICRTPDKERNVLLLFFNPRNVFVERTRYFLHFIISLLSFPPLAYVYIHIYIHISFIPFLVDILLPVIEMRRGTTYRFLVNGGTKDQALSSSSSSALNIGNGDGGNTEYHPFYLTSSISGGYALLDPSERIKQRILAGIRLIVEQPEPNSPYVVSFEPTAMGPLCLYTETNQSQEAANGGRCTVVFELFGESSRLVKGRIPFSSSLLLVFLFVCAREDVI